MRLTIEKGTEKYNLITDSNDPDKKITITTGNDFLDSKLHLLVPDGLGHFGHNVDRTNMTNLDLLAVLNNDPDTKIISQVPEIEQADNLPENALT